MNASATRKSASIATSCTMALLLAGALPASAGPPSNHSAAAVQRVEIHVAPNAVGTRCSPDKPCNLATAQAKTRTILAEFNDHASVKVLLADGIYRLAAPLKFGPADSGTPAHPVEWVAVTGAKPVLSGAARVTRWNVVDQAKNIWAAPVPNTADTRQLYVNGREAPIAATTPAAGHVTFKPVSGGYSVSPAAWIEQLAHQVGAANLARIELVFTGANGAWTQSFCRIASVAGANIRMQQPCWWNVTHRTRFRDATGGLPAMPLNRQPTLIRNAYPFLQPGSWYLDRVSSTLYYRARNGVAVNDLDIEMPQLEILLSGNGTTGNPVHDISFSDITFAGATWLGPGKSAGFADVQDNLRLTRERDLSPQGTCKFSTPPGTCPFGALTREPGNVSFSHAARITFTHNVLTHLGAAGIVLDEGSKHNVINGNVFADIAGNAIILGDPAHPHPTPDLTNEYNRIENNVIHDIGSDYPSAAAITLFFSRHAVVSHNDIYDVPYDGITAGVIQGHVDNADHPDNTTNVNADNVISHNLIHGFMQVLHDGAAIYIEGHQGPGGPTPQTREQWNQYLSQGLLVEGNVAYSQGHANYTWYDDAGADWVRLRANVEWGSAAGGGHGGCQPVGNISYTGNYGSHAIGDWSCTPPAPVHVAFGQNAAIPVHPALSELPVEILQQAGPVGEFRELAAAAAPRISYVRAQKPVATGSATRVLIAGAAFVPGATKVEFKHGGEVNADVLNNGMLIVDAPSGSDPCNLRVTTPGGTVSGTCENHPVPFWTKPDDR